MTGVNQREISDICIVGMGYVGLTLAVGLAQAGFRVHGVENNPATLASLSAGKPHFSETGLDAKFAEYVTAGRILVSEALDATYPATAFVITVGTPIGAQNQVTMGPISQVSRMIAAVLKAGDTVILRSTVTVGTSRNIVKPILDAAGVVYHLAMCPERTVEGEALKELSSLPQIVGGIDAASSNRAAAIFQRMTPEIVTVSSLETAELAKLVCNTQRDLFFAYANEVALMADAVGVNAPEVIHAANFHYPRSRVAKPGLVGGPCLEKDAYLLEAGLKPMGFSPSIVMAGRTLNEELVPHGVAKIAAAIAAQKRAANDVRKIAVLGLAFKGAPETDDIRGSLAIPLFSALKAAFSNAQVVGYDPVAAPARAAEWGLQAVSTLEEAMQGAEIIVIQNNHVAFRDLKLKPLLTHASPRAVLYDFWHCVSPELAVGTQVYHLGLGFDYSA